METKEQKIERLKLEIENRKGTREFLLRSLPLDSLLVQDENETIARLEQELKELEDDGRNSKN